MLRYSVATIALTFLGCFRGGAAQYDSCTNGKVADIGNGRCDAELNVPSCGYDGGDCCPCSCVDGPTHSCSDSDFDCLYPDCGDPTATTGDPTATTEDSGCFNHHWGDGICDSDANHLSCGYDGGDVSLS